MKLEIGRYWNEKDKIGCIVGEFALLAGVNKKILIRAGNVGILESNNNVEKILNAIQRRFSGINRYWLRHLQHLNDTREIGELERLLGDGFVRKIEVEQKKRSILKFFKNKEYK